MVDFLKSALVGKDKAFPEGTEFESLEFLGDSSTQNKYPGEVSKLILDLQIKTEFGKFILKVQKHNAEGSIKGMEFESAHTYCKGERKLSPTSSLQDSENVLPIVAVSFIKDKIFSEDIPCVIQDINSQYSSKQVNNAVEFVNNVANNNYSEYIRSKMDEDIQNNLSQSGREEGFEEGEHEAYKKVAQKMIDLGCSVEEIVMVTNLPKEEVEGMKKRQNK